MDKKQKSFVLLKGEGLNEHVLVGDFDVIDNEIFIKEDSLIKHMQPDGSKGEHFTLVAPAGKARLGQQVEVNPFTDEISRIWD